VPEEEPAEKGILGKWSSKLKWWWRRQSMSSVCMAVNVAAVLSDDICLCLMTGGQAGAV